jgi:hypothetical protein
MSNPAVGPTAARRPALLCVSQSFAPDTTPTAIRASKLLEKLAAEWEITVITEAPGPDRRNGAQVNVVRGRRPRRLFAALRRMRLSKLLEIVVWPDESIFWVLPAVVAGRRLIRKLSPSAIVVFMMPYSSGLIGVALSRLTGLPLILNLDDSPTCTDMHPDFPTRLHYRLATALEDFYVRKADAIVYVSQTNLQSARSRQPEHLRERFHLVRYGADKADGHRSQASMGDFEIAYVGAMTGWWSLIEQAAPASRLERMHAAWSRLGRYERADLDHRTSSPAIIGGAILDAIGTHPSWDGRVKLTIHGNPYPDAVVERALASSGVAGVVSVLGPVSHERVADILWQADLLFLTLPKRVDGSEGGRISAKTYEYLTTDRPILATVPRGENWNFLADKPGVWLADPDDRPRMAEIIAELVAAKFAGRPRTFDRSELDRQISYQTRAAEFAAVVDAALDRRGGGDAGRPTLPRGGDRRPA